MVRGIREVFRSKGRGNRNSSVQYCGEGIQGSFLSKGDQEHLSVVGGEGKQRHFCGEWEPEHFSVI